MKWLVINELRAYRRLLVSKGVKCKVSSKHFADGYWCSAAAWNPVTKRNNYLLVEE